MPALYSQDTVMRHETRDMETRDRAKTRHKVWRLSQERDMKNTMRFETPSLVNTPVIHRVSKNVPPLACYNFDTHEWILIFFWQKC